MRVGAGFVMVQSSGWTLHDDGNNCGILEGFNMLGPEVDHAVTTFLDDVEERGLSDKVLLVVTGEIGADAEEAGEGRPESLVGPGAPALAGGGLKMGQVVGDRTRKPVLPRQRRCGRPT